MARAEHGPRRVLGLAGQHARPREPLVEAVVRADALPARDGRGGPLAVPVDDAARPALGASLGRGTAVLSVGIATTGLVTYTYFSLASHNLSEADYGGITLLWSAVFITVSVLYRPVEQLLSRTIADREARGQTGSEHLRVAATIQLALGVLFAVLALVFRGPLQDDLFEGSSTLYWVLIVTVLAYAASLLRARVPGGRTGASASTAGLVLMEALSRVMFAVAVAVGIASGQSVVALGMAAAPIVSLCVVPWALRVQTGRRQTSRRSTRSPWRTPEFTLAHGTGFAVGGAADHARRADVPERRAAAGEGDRGRRGRRARRLHVQRAADRPGAAAALPGGPDLDPPPPHPARRPRRDRPVQAQRERDADRDRGVRPAWWRW